MAKNKLRFKSKWLKVYETPTGFFFAERKGIDSVAFILIDSERDQIGLVSEGKEPVGNIKMITAFGGSIDDVDKRQDQKYLLETVIKEVEEEAGFYVKPKDVIYCGKVLCSTQMNQFVHLFTVHVKRDEQKEKTSKDPREFSSFVSWLKPEQLTILEDWKAITIYFKYRVWLVTQNRKVSK